MKFCLVGIFPLQLKIFSCCNLEIGGGGGGPKFDMNVKDKLNFWLFNPLKYNFA